MAKQAEEINIRSRARRRLIGAIALALAVVVILPMVLDSEPKITGQDIDLRIPAADKVGEFVPGEAISEVVEAASLAESAVAAHPASGVVIEKLPAATQQGAKPEVRVQTMADTETRQAGVKKPEVKPAETKKPEVKKSEVKRAEANQAEVQIFEKSAGNYIVQVGAFSNAKTAAQEASKLKAWGFKAYTELISGTTRVRVGPYVDRSKADEVRQLLEKHGLHPVIAEVK